MKQIIQVALSRLIHSKGNVRKTGASDEEHGEIKASILAHGLIGNLVVQPPTKDTGKYKVVAGGRRLNALKELAKEGQIEPDMPIDCRVLEEGEDPVEVSTAENMVRVGLHPADQITAFGSFYKDGKGLSVEEIAERFGVTPLVVEKRLRLSQVHPDLIQALRDEEISLDALMAFTLTRDQQQQLKVYNDIRKDKWSSLVSAYKVKERLTAKMVDGNSTLASYVGIKKYEEAGGTLTHDLFTKVEGQGAYIDNPELLRTLAQEKMERRAKTLRKQGWKWVECDVDHDHYDALEHYDHIRMDDHEATEFSDEQKEVSGVLLTIGYDGKAKANEGLVLPEDKAEAVKVSEGGASVTNKPTATKRKDPEAEAAKEAGLNKAIVEDLRVVRMNIARKALALDPKLAHDLLTYQMVRQLFSLFYSYTPLEVRPQSVSTTPPSLQALYADEEQNAKDNPGAVKFEALIKEYEERHKGWLVNDNEATSEDRWRAFLSLDEAEKQNLLALCVAAMLVPQLATEPQALPEIEDVIEWVQPPFTQFRPSASFFWGRLSKPTLVALLEELGGKEWAAQHKTAKKGELAEFMEQLFARPENAAQLGLDADGQARVQEWIPVGFRREVGKEATQ